MFRCSAIIIFSLFTIALLSYSNCTPNFICPPFNLSHPLPTYFPDPIECSKYYMCAAGVPIPRRCPFDMCFNMGSTVVFIHLSKNYQIN